MVKNWCWISQIDVLNDTFPSRIDVCVLSASLISSTYTGGRIQIYGHSDFGIFNDDGASSILTWVQPDTASAACPEHPGSLDIMSMTFIAVICDADDPCSVNNAYDPESSFSHCHLGIRLFLCTFQIEAPTPNEGNLWTRTWRPNGWSGREYGYLAHISECHSSNSSSSWTRRWGKFTIRKESSLERVWNS